MAIYDLKISFDYTKDTQFAGQVTSTDAAVHMPKDPNLHLVPPNQFGIRDLQDEILHVYAKSVSGIDLRLKGAFALKGRVLGTKQLGLLASPDNYTSNGLLLTTYKMAMKSGPTGIDSITVSVLGQKHVFLFSSSERLEQIFNALGTADLDAVFGADMNNINYTVADCAFPYPANANWNNLPNSYQVRSLKSTAITPLIYNIADVFIEISTDDNSITPIAIFRESTNGVYIDFPATGLLVDSLSGSYSARSQNANYAAACFISDMISHNLITLDNLPVPEQLNLETEFDLAIARSKPDKSLDSEFRNLQHKHSKLEKENDEYRRKNKYLSDELEEASRILSEYRNPMQMSSIPTRLPDLLDYYYYYCCVGGIYIAMLPEEYFHDKKYKDKPRFVLAIDVLDYKSSNSSDVGEFVNNQIQVLKGLQFNASMIIE